MRAAQILLSLMSFASLVAHAENAENTADIRCVIVGAQLASSSDPAQRSNAGLLLSYYIGRLDGRAPGLNLEALIADELGRLTPGDLQRETRRCSNTLTAKGKEIARIGESLTRLGK
jgi:hypothetical protein